MCIYVSIIIKTCNKVSSTNTSSKQLQMACGYITINKVKKKYIYIYIYSHGWWNLISSIGEPERKWLYWNLRSSCSGHQLMSPTTWFTICNWSLYIQLQNATLDLSNWTVTLPFDKEMNYTYNVWYSSLK